MLNIDADGADVFCRLDSAARRKIVEQDRCGKTQVIIGLIAGWLGIGTVGDKCFAVDRTRFGLGKFNFLHCDGSAVSITDVDCGRVGGANRVECIDCLDWIFRNTYTYAFH